MSRATCVVGTTGKGASVHITRASSQSSPVSITLRNSSPARRPEGVTAAWGETRGAWSPVRSVRPSIAVSDPPRGAPVPSHGVSLPTRHLHTSVASTLRANTVAPRHGRPYLLPATTVVLAEPMAQLDPSFLSSASCACVKLLCTHCSSSRCTHPDTKVRDSVQPPTPWHAGALSREGTSSGKRRGHGAVQLQRALCSACAVLCAQLPLPVVPFTQPPTRRRCVLTTPTKRARLPPHSTRT